jgi:hypothetical protein
MDPVEPAAPETVEPTAPVEPAEPAAPPEGEPPKDPRVEKANAEAAKYRKELREAQAALKAREDAEKTEAEKEAEAKAESAKEIATLRRERAALKAGLPEELAARLVGDTPEELAEDADRLKALLTPPESEPVDPPKGWPNAPQGPRGNPKPPGIAQQIADAEAAGNYDEAMRLRMAQVAQQTPVGP